MSEPGNLSEQVCTPRCSAQRSGSRRSARPGPARPSPAATAGSRRRGRSAGRQHGASPGGCGARLAERGAPGLGCSHRSGERCLLCRGERRLAPGAAPRSLHPCYAPSPPPSPNAFPTASEGFKRKNSLPSVAARNALAGFSTCNHTSGREAGKRTQGRMSRALLAALALILTVD